MSDAPVQETPVSAECDVCIVGAGIAGMNALFAASRYLSRGQKIVLVDRRARVGGMWVDTYSYVRLHQPHGMFTAGNIGWTLGREPSYLATKSEVLGHFEHCLTEIRQRVQVDEYFGWTMESDDETGTGVRVTCLDADGRRVVVKAKRLIKAYGFRITPNDPLTVSSSAIISVSPDSCDVRSGDLAASDAPVWIIGGGKTAMDTAHTLITEYPGREVNLVAGSGTFFNSRDKIFPAGAKRWWSGQLTSALAREITRRFDGTNEDDVWDWHKGTYGTSLTPQTGKFLLGVLSEGENSTIAAGLGEVVMDYLVDVIDENGAPEMVLRSGETKKMQPGSWVINCTGYFGGRHEAYEPFVSASGDVMTVHLRSATTHLSSYGGYFLTHLLLLDKLKELPLYEVDGYELLAASPKAFPYVMMTLVQHNLSLIADVVPARVFQDCGLNADRWYPAPRQLLGTAQFLRTHRRHRERQRQTLDTVRERFGIRCGPVERVSR